MLLPGHMSSSQTTKVEVSPRHSRSPTYKMEYFPRQVTFPGPRLRFSYHTQTVDPIDQILDYILEVGEHWSDASFADISRSQNSDADVASASDSDLHAFLEVPSINPERNIADRIKLQHSVLSTAKDMQAILAVHKPPIFVTAEKGTLLLRLLPPSC